LGKIKARGAKVIGVNPIRSGYNAISDEWVGITPGTDGLFILALVHELMRAGKIDLNYLARYTNAPVLINSDPKSPEHGLLMRDPDGKQLVVDSVTGKLTPFDQPGVRPDLSATYRHGGVTHRPVFHLMAERYMDPSYSADAVTERVGIPANKIRRIAAEIARIAFEEAIELDQEWTDFRGETHAKMTGRPVSFHAMRGISAHSNGFQTCRALHMLQIILGSVEVPGGFRFKPPYPKPPEVHPKPHCKVTPGAPLDGPHLGFVHGPDDLALKADGSPARIDKAFTWENPMSAHGLMHMVISNAHAGNPYKIDTLFMYMANMSWNSSMNTSGVIEMLTDKDENGDYVIPNIIYSDAYSSEMVAYADLILPDTTYLERHDCISLLDRPICEADAAADAIRWPVIEPDRNVRGFQSVLCELGARLNLPGFTNEDGHQKYTDYADYIVNHIRKPGIGPLAGFRGNGSDSGRGEVNKDQLNRYIGNGGFFVEHIPNGANYYKPWNIKYQDWAVKMGL
ncbi:MAG: molybdopterin-dependent oxidoreductase, partial [Paracoccaceae bacterium]|nr:molybdopterin-dependent oxidoreductase [Paracoccaceae bacterium]